jgi:hypothetical protein
VGLLQGQGRHGASQGIVRTRVGQCQHEIFSHDHSSELQESLRRDFVGTLFRHRLSIVLEPYYNEKRQGRVAVRGKICRSCALPKKTSTNQKASRIRPIRTSARPKPVQAAFGNCLILNIETSSRTLPPAMTATTAQESTQPIPTDALAALTVAMEAVNEGKSHLNGTQSHTNCYHLALRRLTPPSACALFHSFFHLY